MIVALCDYREDSPMEVEIDVFSGRPNPSWEASNDEMKSPTCQLTVGTPSSNRGQGCSHVRTCLPPQVRFDLMALGQMARPTTRDRLVSFGAGTRRSGSQSESYRGSDAGSSTCSAS